MVGLLEYLEGADTGGLYHLIALDVQGCRVDIDPADLPVAGFGAVCQPDGVGYEFRSVFGVLAIDQNQSFVSFVLQGFHFADQFLVGEGVAYRCAQRAAESAVLAVIGAVIAYVQRGKQYDAVAVHRAFELPGSLEYLMQALG